MVSGGAPSRVKIHKLVTKCEHQMPNYFGCLILTSGNIIIIIIIWSGDTVTVTHLTKCNTNSKVRAMSA